MNHESIARIYTNTSCLWRKGMMLLSLRGAPEGDAAIPQFAVQPMGFTHFGVSMELRHCLIGGSSQ